jgi:hypothetical protein
MNMCRRGVLAGVAVATEDLDRRLSDALDEHELQPTTRR